MNDVTRRGRWPALAHAEGGQEALDFESLAREQNSTSAGIITPLSLFTARLFEGCRTHAAQERIQVRGGQGYQPAA
eukprot:gene31856-7062_t